MEDSKMENDEENEVESKLVNIRTTESGKKKIAVRLICTFIGLILAGGIGIFAVVKTGIFLPPSQKVLLAVVNTFNNNGTLTDTINTIGNLEKKEYTVRTTLDTDHASMDWTYRNSEEKKQVEGNINVLLIPEINILFDVDASEQQKQTDLLQRISEEYQSLSFEKTENEVFNAGGETHDCKGYEATITEENMQHILDGIESIYESNHGERSGILNMLVPDYMDKLREDVSTAGPVKVYFYIYKGKLAAVKLTSDERQIMEFVFHTENADKVMIDIMTDGSDIVASGSVSITSGAEFY